MRDDEYSERPSRSARKRESQALQDLGESLIGLPDAMFGELPLPDTLRDAVLAARRMKSHGALLRQRQYIGKLMRKVDAGPIRAALIRLEERQKVEARRFHRVEQWRDRLLAEGEPALRELLAGHPAGAAEDLAHLIAEARRERDSGEPPRAARLLFRRLRELLG